MLSAITNHIKRTWKGEEKLWKVFWIWEVLGNIIWAYTFSYIIFPFIEHFIQPLYWDAPQGFVDSKANAITAIIMPIIYSIYVAFAFIVLWKNSANQPSVLTRKLIKIFISFIVLTTVLAGGLIWFLGIQLILHH